MKKSNHFVLTSVGIGLLVTSIDSPAAILAGYDFNDAEDSTTSVVTQKDTNISATNFTGGPGLSYDFNTGVTTATGDTTGLDASGQAFGTSGSTGAFAQNQTTAGNVGNYNAAITQNRYFTFTLTPTAGFEMTLTSFTFNAGLVNTARSLEFYGLNIGAPGFTASTVDSIGGSASITSTTTNGEMQDIVIPLAGTAFENITEATEFRLYIWGATGSASSSATIYDKFVVNGSVNAIPEPASLSLLGLGALGLMSRRRRH